MSRGRASGPAIYLPLKDTPMSSLADTVAVAAPLLPIWGLLLLLGFLSWSPRRDEDADDECLW